MNTVKEEEAVSRIRSKAQFYEALQRVGYKLPQARQPIVTIDFLHAVRAQTIYCPRVKELQLLPCV